MIVIEDNFNLIFDSPTYIALGSFDGLHLGHMSLITKVVELSKANKAKSMVYTFKNHPLSVIDSYRVPKLIMKNETKLKLLEKHDVDIVNLANFDMDFMMITPENFIRKMVESYKVKGVIAGFNYRFGYKNQGDVNLLVRMCKRLNVETYIMDSVKYGNEVISSTKIRELLSTGDITTANKMLIEPFSINGIVIQGRQLGHTIGFPTANLEFDKEFVIPKGGVYFTMLECNNRRYKGITNIGFNPTVKGNILSIETHILNFNKIIYGDKIKLYFVQRIRDEINFDSIESLSYQLEKDKKFADKQSLPIF